VSQRAFDLTPEPGIDIEGQKLGGAAGFLSFIENQVIPYVDQKYRTIPTERGFLGHSYGGVFGLYTLLNRPHLFQKIAALDPTSVVAKGTLLSKLKEIGPQTKFNSRLYIALGTQEPDASLTENTVFLRALRALQPAGLNYRAGYYAENHSASVPCAIVPALKWLYHPEVPSESYPGENAAQNDF
jgi:predicted alpha/beta superfamily hydrolase